MKKQDAYATSTRWIGSFLIAMPHLSDPYFSESIVLLCGKDEEGAIGFIVNHRIHGIFLSELFNQVKLAPQPQPVNNPPLFLGGPLDMERGFVIHSNDFQGPDTLPIFRGVSLSNSMDVLKAIAQGSGPKQFIVCMGFASWDNQQLEKEIEENSWLMMPATKKFLFTSNPSLSWKRAYEYLKVNPSLISLEGGKA